MQQQINLFQPVFRKQEKVFSAVMLLQIAAIVLVLLIIVLLQARWTLADMQRSAQELEQRHQHLEGQLQALEEARRAPGTEAVDAEIERLQTRIDQRNALLVQLDQLVLLRGNGFAAQFRALAEQRIPGLWLEGVTISRSGDIEIRGVTLDEKLVPVYLRQLGTQQDLSQSSFETVSMTRSEPDDPRIQFVLRNHRGDMSWQ
jgi:Tfp pilus assembly protein PilN